MRGQTLSHPRYSKGLRLLALTAVSVVVYSMMCNSSAEPVSFFSGFLPIRNATVGAFEAGGAIGLQQCEPVICAGNLAYELDQTGLHKQLCRTSGSFLGIGQCGLAGQVPLRTLQEDRRASEKRRDATRRAVSLAQSCTSARLNHKWARWTQRQPILFARPLEQSVRQALD